MTRLMAAQGLCRIDTLAVAGEPVAMGIVLRSGDRAYYWKTAYDERFARHSPGKRSRRRSATLQCSRPDAALTDSCAIPDHPMIDGVWSGRMKVADCLVACPGHGDASHSGGPRWGCGSPEPRGSGPRGFTRWCVSAFREAVATTRTLQKTALARRGRWPASLHRKNAYVT